MSTVTATPAIGKHEVFMINNTDKKTGPVRRDTLNSNRQVHFSYPLTWILPVTSRHYLGAGQGYVPTQYIPGANTIFVEDYIDDDGKQQLGLKSQKYDLLAEANRAKGIAIKFEKGLLDLRKYGSNPTLTLFLNTHESNSESPAGMNKNATINRIHTFAPLKAEEKAVKRSVKFEDSMDAMDIVRSLRTKDGDKAYKYNEAKLHAIVTIMGFTQKLGPNDLAQRFETVMMAATANPLEFKEIVETGLAAVETMIAKAIATDILTMSATNVKMKLPNTEAVEIYKFKSEVKADQRTQALAYHLLGNPEAKSHRQSIQAEVEKL